MSKIIYVNQKLLFDPRLNELRSGYHYNWDNFHGITQLNPGHDGAYVRAGTNTLPLRNDLVNCLNFQMPLYDPNAHVSFAEATDFRATHLRANRFDKRWLILWSGGIDSMVIVASLLKNFSPADLANIDIACNRISIYENPQFYYQHIEPNFAVVDSNFLNFDQLLNKYYIIDGDPADQLYGGFANRSMLGGNAILKDWRRDPDQLLDMLAAKSGRAFAEWYYETVKANIDSVPVPVDNYYDFCWWIFFNFSWCAILLRPLQFQSGIDSSSLKLYFDNFIAWYNTAEYQQWSMTTRLGVKYAVNIAHRKLASKQYIYEFDHDEYYYKFKTKMESVSRPTPNWNGYFCILDDYSRLTLDNDLEQIMTLLPDHITL